MKLIATGKTFNHRARLLDLGGRWDDDNKRWFFNYGNKRIKQELTKLIGVMVSEDTPEPMRAPTEPSDDADDIVSVYGDDKPSIRDGKTIIYGDDDRWLNYFKDKNPISYCGFSNLEKLISFIEKIPEHKRRGERGAGWQIDASDFRGTRTMREAMSLARDGWQDGIDNAARVLEFLNIEHATSKRRTYSVAGGTVNVGRMLAGDPAHMVHRSKRPAKRVVTLFVQNNGSAAIETSNMIVRSAICCAIVDLMETNGYSCEIVSVTTDYLRRDGTPSEHLVVTLKQAGEKMNLADIAFALGHPAFFRRFGFAIIGQADELEDAWWNYGYSTEAFNSHYQPKPNEFYIPHLKRNVADDTLENMACAMLPLVKPAGLPIEIG